MSWIYCLLLGAVFMAAGYTLIPDVFLHRMGIGSWKRHYAPGVAITFDDGPDPLTTPQILDILDHYRVRAVFFVTGANAARYPNLIKDIQKRGHQIGGHSALHRYAWFVKPQETWREWDECVRIIEGLTGEPLQWVRPPWGTFNFVTWLWIKIRQKRAVLWNIEGHDWQARRTPEQIASRILSRTKEGSIIVLHDAGGEPGAPQNTVAALKIICREVVEGQKIPLTMPVFPNWPWWRRLIFSLWEKWERHFAIKYRVERINSTNFLRLSKTIYEGPNLYTGDGRLAAKAGDVVGEIHFDSARVMDNDNNVPRAALRVLRLARESLPEMALYITENPEYREIDVFFGLTLIHRGVTRFGFKVQDLPLKGFKRGIRFMHKVIMWVYNPVRKTQTEKRDGGKTKLVWITRQELLERWLPENFS